MTTPAVPPLTDAVVEQTPAAPVNKPVAADLPPPFPQLQRGDIPAVLVPPVDPQVLQQVPAVAVVVENFDKLPSLGIEVYEAEDKSSVLYNPKKITEQELAAAESNGTLDQLAVSILQQAEAGQNTEAALQTPPLTDASVGAPQVSESRLTSARIQNLNPRQVSPVQPKPLTGALGRRAM